MPQTYGKQKTKLISLPSQSQDINMIENVGKIIKLRLQKHVQNIDIREGASRRLV